MTMESFHFSPGAYLAPIVDWLNTNLHPLFSAIGYLVETALSAIEGVLLAAPPFALIGVVVVATFFLVNLRMAVLAGACLGFCVIVGFWEASMQTIALVSVAVAISVIIGFPIGVLCARSKALESIVRPILDVMQTVPPWVYLIPAVMIFSLGRVPAIIATIVYGVPPMLRLTTLAFKQIPVEFRELGSAVGAHPRSILWKIEFPLAKQTILVGLNQCILLSLAMVVLAGLVGAGGLGAEVTRGLTRMEMGLGLRAGLAIVAVALLMDRLSRVLLDRPALPAS